jgi:hypothetical protein
MESKIKSGKRPGGSLLIERLPVRDMINLLRAETGRPGDVIQTEVDLWRAWLANRGRMMQLRSDEFPFGYLPGTRPRCWWRFEVDEANQRWVASTAYIEPQPDGRDWYHILQPECEFLARHSYLTDEEIAFGKEHYFRW